MKFAFSPSLWFRLWARPARATPSEPADLGTAFGLDASFDAPPAAPVAAAKAKGHPAPSRGVARRRPA